MLRGSITRQLIVAIALLTLLSVGIALGAFGLLLISDNVLSEVTAHSQIATLSARIRSESLTLLERVNDYMQPAAERAPARAKIADQQSTLDNLERQTLALASSDNVEESLRLSGVRQNLIAFTTQANRVVNTFEQEGTRGPQAEHGFTLLVQSYQAPLLAALIDFEQLELAQVQATQTHARQVVTAVSYLLVAMAAFALLVGALMIYQVMTRIVTPLGKLRAGVEDIRQGRFDRPVPIDTPDEIGGLADAFNTMAAEVRASRQQLEDYAHTLEQQVAARTHEVERRANQVITGVEISRAISSLLDPDELVKLVVQLILERYDFYAAGLFLMDDTRRYMVLRYGLGLGQREFGTGSLRLEVGGHSIVGQAARWDKRALCPM